MIFSCFYYTLGQYKTLELFFFCFFYDGAANTNVCGANNSVKKQNVG